MDTPMQISENAVQQSEGCEQAIRRAVSAGGGAFSGGTLKALTRYAQDAELPERPSHERDERKRGARPNAD
jgi:hypothetical protein